MERKTHKIDASNQAVGRLASQIALILRGKNKPEYEPHKDEGDIVVVENIRDAKFTGKKIEQKKYFRYSGYPGGIKETKIKNLLASNPAQILVNAVKQMLPANKLRKDMLKRLNIK